LRRNGRTRAREKARDDDALLAEAMRTLDLLYSGYSAAA